MLSYCFIFIEPFGFLFPVGLMGDQKKVCSVEEKIVLLELQYMGEP